MELEVLVLDGVNDSLTHSHKWDLYLQSQILMSGCVHLQLVIVTSTLLYMLIT